MDDKQENLYLLEKLLKGNGYDVASATHGAEALEALHADDFDMIIADILMPVMDGFQLCRKSKRDEKLKDIPFVFYTAAYSDEKDEELALRIGADKFIRKPVEPEELIKIIKGVFQDIQKGEAKHKKPASEEDDLILKLYNQRLVKKLEEKMVDLESEVTERKKAEEKLRESEKLLLSILNHHFQLTGMIDLQGRLVEANQTALDFMGADRSEIIGKLFWEIPCWEHSKEEQNKLKEEIRKAFEGEFVRFETTHKTFGGDIRRMDFSLNPVKDENDDVIYIIPEGRDVTELKKAESDLRKAYLEIQTLKDQLEAENIYLREEVGLHHRHEKIIGQSKALEETLKLAEQVAGTDSTVLILGETGTGKELLAQSIHNLSKRKDRLMVKVNCAAMPSALIESELFGHEKGAYTSALTAQAGRFEIANGSTLFLDEIGEMPLELQVKLLRVLQDGEFERLGSTKTLAVDVRLIAATNRDLAQAVKEGKFRSDLYYRLNVFPIAAPPLRERREDIFPLVWFFIREFDKRMGKVIKSIPKRDIEALQGYSWPGNIRELRNFVERSMILAKSSTLHFDFPQKANSLKSERRKLSEVEKDHIISVLKYSGWRIRGGNGAAAKLGLKPTTLEARIKKLGITRDPHSSRIS